MKILRNIQCPDTAFWFIMNQVKHIVTFSGGKDSLRLLIWAEENLGAPGVDWIPVSWDTGWEHPITYAHIEEINKGFLGGTLVRRASSNYPGGFVQMCVDRKCFPSVKRRFCTQELKVMVQHELLQELDDEATLYQGIRADESEARSRMLEEQWVDEAGGYMVKRPLLKMTVDEVFAGIARRGLRPNPLYLTGQSRVGCWPCIMTGLRELKQMIKVEPELRKRMVDLEAYVNNNVGNKETRKWPATFWAAGTIPDRFCSLKGLIECRKCKGTGKISGELGDNLFSIGAEPSAKPCERCSGKGEYIASVPTAEDIFDYVESTHEHQLPIEQPKSCMSVYNLCE